ncbi:hypothetical protein QT327_03680 [Olivibacter sp. 47]|uniref:hypothetical protein n=1 Tax=Olivibacter sp. 47 TaxID=3056486 RepID=UPI0025A47AA6|nr:hypothetical protein [Olivibacter sp. 47]MDM8173466.1 hypothetical protein [Olivibacter sp. 47]
MTNNISNSDIQKGFLKKAETRFDKFINELKQESDRGAAIFAATFFEYKLKEILRELLNDAPSTKNLLEDANGGLNTFSAKINICLSLGYITRNEYNALNHLKKIRNQFAHNFDFQFSFSDAKITALCKSLKNEFKELKEEEFETAREIFIGSIIFFHRQLIDRQYELFTFAPIGFKIEEIHNDPNAYINLGANERMLEEHRFLEQEWAKQRANRKK